MTTQPPDLKKLREVAEKATAGPWYADEPIPGVRRFIVADCGPIGKVYPCDQKESHGTTSMDDARFIAEANPQTILALLDAYEASARDAETLKAKVAGFTAVLKRYQDARVFTNIHTRQIARSIAEDAELDTARLLDDAARHATRGD